MRGRRLFWVWVLMCVLALAGCEPSAPVTAPVTARPAQPAPVSEPAPAPPPDAAPTPSPAPASSPAPAAQPPLGWRQDAAQALREARAAGRPALVDFWAAWCQPCVRLDGETFGDARVRAALARFVIVRVDATHPSADAQALIAAYKVGGYPTLLLIDSQGLPSRRHRFERFVGAEELLRALSEVP